MTAPKRKSKKQSVTQKQNKKRHRAFVFFLERSLESKLVLEALQDAGAWVEPHAKHFKHDTPDTIWLKHCGRKHWVVLMKDKEIYHNYLERRTLLRAGVRAFVLVSGRLRGIEMAEIMVKALPKIIEFSRNNSAPFLAKIYKDSSIEPWL